MSLKSARLILEERESAWTLTIEPWAVAIEVPALKRAYVEVFDEQTPFNLEIAQDGAFLAFESGKFCVMIDGDRQDFDFGQRAFSFDAWPD